MAGLSEKFHRLLKKVNLKNVVDHGGGYEKLESGDQKRSGGCFPVYVGEEGKRYMVPTAVANSPAFVAMLDKYQDDDDFTRSGPLTLPCSALAFEHVLRRAREQKHNRPPVH